MRTIKWNGEELEVLFQRYQGGHNCIRLQSFNGEPYATASINDPEADLKAGEVIIKNYSENEGVLEALEEAGIVEPLYLLYYGCTNGVVCKLLKPTN
jgi:hypothetical protein